jgi:hypothetical protein
MHPWMYWSSSSRSCRFTIHGCSVVGFMRPKISNDISGRYIFTASTSLEQCHIRKMAFDIMVAIGVNITLDEDNLGENYFVLAAYLGQAIIALEQYDGNGDYNIAIFKAVRVLSDFRGGGQRERIRFFLKRIPCTCLKAKYSMIKKSQPTRMSECYTCQQSKELRSLMLCERCKSIQYCCKECQAADWSIHKDVCKEIHAYEMKK